MENTKQVGGGSASSFTTDLFGPKDSSSSPPSSVFGSVFGPSSTGLSKDSSHSGSYGSTRKQDYGSQYGNGNKYGTSDNNMSRRGKGGDNRGKDQNQSSIYQQSETAEPCNFSSSIYYGGQEVYSPPTNHNTSTASQHTFNKDGKSDEDPNGNTASRGNWWQGSLYY